MQVNMRERTVCACLSLCVYLYACMSQASCTHISKMGCTFFLTDKYSELIPQLEFPLTELYLLQTDISFQKHTIHTCT